MELKKAKVHKLVNNFFSNGKKTRAEGVVLNLLRKSKSKHQVLPTDLLNTVLENISPLVTLKSKKVGGITYRIPVHIFGSKSELIAVKWLVSSSCGRKIGSRSVALDRELASAFKNQGEAVKKKKSLHNLAILNRAYIKFL